MAQTEDDLLAIGKNNLQQTLVTLLATKLDVAAMEAALPGDADMEDDEEAAVAGVIDAERQLEQAAYRRKRGRWRTNVHHAIGGAGWLAGLFF